MTISSQERDNKKVKIIVDRNVVDTTFEKWAKPGHFSRTLAKGPKTTTWIGTYMLMLMILIVIRIH
jgi:photosystem I P700 chlorophyll a apoprotein A1